VRIIAFFIFFLGVSPAFSQILNIERYRLERDTSKTMRIKATGGVNVFNRSASADAPVNLFGYRWDVNSMYQPGKHAYIAISNFDYLRINESDFLNFGLIHGRVVFNREQKSNIEAFLQYSFDNFRGLEPRWIAGSALRYKVVKSEKVTLILGMGAMYEHERWLHPGTRETVEVTFIKSTNYASLRYTINEYLDLNLVNYYQVGFDREEDFFRNRFSGNINLNSRISERFSLTNSLDFSYEDRPIVPITPLIYAFRVGISYDL
jgi:hypothetical protein